MRAPSYAGGIFAVEIRASLLQDNLVDGHGFQPVLGPAVGKLSLRLPFLDKKLDGSLADVAVEGSNGALDDYL